MVTPQLGVKIIDFGVARLLADNTPRLTLPADTVGAIAYMSPEQAQGFDVDGRADLYSLGCVLYQLLSGRPPFFSTLPGALLMMQVMDRPTPLNVPRPDLPAGLSELISDLMEKDPDARPANAAQVISRIAAIEGRLGAEAPEFEADRQTVRASDRQDPVAGTRYDGVTPESGRATILTPERMAELSGPNTVGMPPWELAAPPVRRPTPPPVPPQPGPPIRSEPQAAAGRGNGTPDWPSAPRAGSLLRRHGPVGRAASPSRRLRLRPDRRARLGRYRGRRRRPGRRGREFPRRHAHGVRPG
jgi:serine/threonine protein kinase